MNTSASAPGKIILFGEHFVVYDKPAILASLNKRIYVKVIRKHYEINNEIVINNELFGNKSYPISIFRNLKKRKIISDEYYPILFITKKIFNENKYKESLEFTFKSDIPYGMGLGSSAAAAVATVAALSKIFNRKVEDKKILKLAIEAEKLVHKNSSGADCVISAHGGLIFFQKHTRFKKVAPKKELSFILINTGIRHSTGQLVNIVKKYQQQNPREFVDLCKTSEEITKRAARALEEGDNIMVGELMTENQRLLQKIGVSNKIIDRIINLSSEYGALGSKITGAGGGGCILVLTEQENRENFISKIRKEGFECISVTLESRGLLY